MNEYAAVKLLKRVALAQDTFDALKYKCAEI